MNSSVEKRYFSSSEAIVSVISTTVYCRKRRANEMAKEKAKKI